jgi:hypothetical protein
VLKECKDLSPSKWIRENTDVIETRPDFWHGNFVSHCVPKVFEAYCKLFHEIYDDGSVLDHRITWNDVAKAKAMKGDSPLDSLQNEATWIYGGEYDPALSKRIRWKELADQCKLTFHPEITVDSFTRSFPGGSWPRYLIGPEEGRLENGTCREIVRTIALCNSDFEVQQNCFFHYDLIATNTFEVDLLFEGNLIDVFQTQNDERVHGTPTHWWPEDRSWFLCTDWDLPFTLVGGASKLIERLISNPELEAIEVKSSTRIDYKSDNLNP